MQVRHHDTCRCCVTRSQRPLTHVGMVGMVGKPCSQRWPACPEVDPSVWPSIVEIWNFQLSAPNPLLPHHRSTLGTRAPGRQKNSPRLGLLTMFSVDEVALHTQHHMVHIHRLQAYPRCHGATSSGDGLDRAYIVQSLYDNGTAHQW